VKLGKRISSSTDFCASFIPKNKKPKLFEEATKESELDPLLEGTQMWKVGRWRFIKRDDEE